MISGSSNILGSPVVNCRHFNILSIADGVTFVANVLFICQDFYRINTTVLGIKPSPACKPLNPKFMTLLFTLNFESPNNLREMKTQLFSLICELRRH